MQFLSDWMFEALRFFAFFGGYGWGIIWLTIAVNLALYPLTLSSLKSMGTLQKIQPRLQELQRKYKDNPQELQRQTMDLYRSEGVNPLGGCLPVLLKIPFFLALFWAFQSSAFLQIASQPQNNTGFLWISGRVAATAFHSRKLVDRLVQEGLLVPDQRASQQGKDLYVWNLVAKVGEKTLKDILWATNAERANDVEKVQKALAQRLPGLEEAEARQIIAAWEQTSSLAKPERLPTPWGSWSLFAILIGLTTFLMQKTMPAAAGQQGQTMTWFMPLFIAFISWNFPAGVQLYWLVSNAVGAIQQYFIMRQGHLRYDGKEAR